MRISGQAYFGPFAHGQRAGGLAFMNVLGQQMSPGAPGIAAGATRVALGRGVRHVFCDVGRAPGPRGSPWAPARSRHLASWAGNGSGLRP